jgi:hypothetical protein
MKKKKYKDREVKKLCHFHGIPVTRYHGLRSFRSDGFFSCVFCFSMLGCFLLSSSIAPAIDDGDFFQKPTQQEGVK